MQEQGPSPDGGHGTATADRDQGPQARPRPTRRSALVRAAGLLVVVAAGAVVALTVDLPGVASIRASIDAAGAWGPVVFVGLYAVTTLVPIPHAVMSAVAGLVFGLGTGSLLVWAGAVLGSLGSFWVGRLLGREAVERFTGARVARVDALLTRRGLLSMIAVRLVPVLPFTAINYAAGLSAVRLRDYLLGTAVGIVPGTVAYVALGAYATSGLSWPLVAAVAALVALSAVGVLAARRSRRRARGGAEQPAA